jgi:GH24 family phage-related lysozyme (muramidase)
MTVRDPQPCPRKPIFDTVRTLIRRGLRQNEVDRLDEASDGTAGTDLSRAPAHPAHASVPRIRRTALKIGPEGIALIKHFEGCARLRRDGLLEAYPDPASGGEPWTIGWGATGPGLTPGSRIGPGTVWTQEQCDARLEADLHRYGAEVATAIGGAPTTQRQFDALVSFHYNTGAIARATLTRRHREGDHAAAAGEFARWNRAGGRVVKGLVRRRAAEAELYLS